LIQWAHKANEHYYYFSSDKKVDEPAKLIL